MKLLTVCVDSVEQLGVQQEDLVFLPARQDTTLPNSMLVLVDGGPDALAALRHAYESAGAEAFVPADQAELLAPIPRPRQNVMCMGLNYADHVEEAATSLGRERDDLPKYPIVFTKAANSVNAPYGDIPYDASVSDKLDWEVELGVVIGRSARGIAEEEALGHVFGYTVINDVSARELQRRHKQFFIGKSLSGFCPMGPCIVTADEIEDPHDLDLWCRVNGVEKQSSNTRYQIFRIEQQIACLSQGMVLEAGDILATGTPSGVGFARTPPEYLQPGDVVECGVEGIGVLRNRVCERNAE